MDLQLHLCVPLTQFDRAVAQPCYCGEPNCKGVIGGGNAKYNLGDQTAPDSEQSEEEAEMEALDLSAATPKTKLMKKEQIRKRMNRPLESPDEVQLFVKKMLGSVGKAKLVEKLLYRLEMTESTTSNGREILKKFVRLHGLKMLKFWLGEWKNESDLVKKVSIALFFHITFTIFGTDNSNLGSSCSRTITSSEQEWIRGQRYVRGYEKVYRVRR